MEGGTAAFVSTQCFQMLRAMADTVIKWQPHGSILICHQLTVVSKWFSCMWEVAWCCVPCLVHALVGVIDVDGR